MKIATLLVLVAAVAFVIVAIRYGDDINDRKTEQCAAAGGEPIRDFREAVIACVRRGSLIELPTKVDK